MMKLLLGFCFLFLGAGIVMGQGSHYTYPFSIECPDYLVHSGQVVPVTAKFEGGYTGSTYSPTYNWTVSAGVITTGQGTPTINIEIGKEDAGTILTVTLSRIFGEPHFPGVQRDASCSISISPEPVPRLVDEFRTTGSNCEEGFARLDNFFVELNSNPTSEAYIVFYGDTEDKRAADRRASQLRNHFVFRKFPQERVTMIRGVAKENGMTQFWLVPPGADTPNFERAPEVIVKPPTQPYFYASVQMDGVPGCFGNFYDLGEYAKELKSLPGSTGRIVISEGSRASFNRELAEIRTELAATGIPRNRYTAVYKYVRPNRMLEVVELWIIPAKATGVNPDPK